MNKQTSGYSPKSRARVTGAIGMLVLIFGSYTHSINSKIVFHDDAIQTAQNLLNSEAIYRWGFMSSLLMETAFIFYAFCLFQLLKNINQKTALLMLVLALLPAPIFYLNQLNHFAILLLTKEGITDQILFYLYLHKTGGFIISIFFGLWLLPLGYLVYRSVYLPKYIGVFLMIGSLGYLINCVQGILFPGTEKTLWTNPFLVLTHLAEILLMGWLLIMGLNNEKYMAMEVQS